MEGTPSSHFQLSPLLISVKPHGGSRTWVGLFNPEAVDCGSESACTGKLYWSDGDVLIGTRVDDLGGIDLENTFSTFYNTGQNKIEDAPGVITNNYPYLCEINCAMDVYIE